MELRWKPACVTLAMLVMASVTAGCQHAVANDANPPADADDDDTTLSEDATDTSDAESNAQLVTSSLISSSAAGSIGLASSELDGSDISTRTLGDGVKASYLPRGCLTVSLPVQDSVTYRFAGCRVGPNGLGNVSGELTVHYAAGPQHLHMDVTATGVAVNGANFDFSATADVTTSAPAATDRTMVWKAQLSGTSAGGRDFMRTNSRTVTWTLGDSCFSLSGESEGQIRKRDIRTEISNFRRCRGSCPDAGGKITITNVAKDKQIELIYDGTNHATYVGPAGHSVSVPLLCTP